VELTSGFLRINVSLIFNIIIVIGFFFPVKLPSLPKLSFLIVIIIKIVELSLSIFLCSHIQLHLSPSSGFRIEFYLLSVDAFYLIVIQNIVSLVVPLGFLKQILAFLFTLGKTLILLDMLTRLNSFIF